MTDRGVIRTATRGWRHETIVDRTRRQPSDECRMVDNFAMLLADDGFVSSGWR